MASVPSPLGKNVSTRVSSDLPHYSIPSPMVGLDNVSNLDNITDILNAGKPSSHSGGLEKELRVELETPESGKKSVEHPLEVDCSIIILDEHLIAQVQDIVNTSNVALNSALANRVISLISADLGNLENELAAFPTNNSCDLLNLERVLVSLVLGTP